MIDINDVIVFFDNIACKWDDMEIKSDSIINKILDNAEVRQGNKVLDVACGTGIMIPYYLERNVLTVDAVDISPKMVEIAKHKFADKDNVDIICSDVFKCEFDHKFDNIVIYNAFPHFCNPENLIEYLSGKLNEGGVLTVAHGMSREKIDAHHRGCAHDVSNGLM
ncbi:MAG: class I SAM-dependent methyltransferase, partial [Butyrivibrio sp.]|nr:class I SAM-dependent methyltransferase [Butyrivibrio sp.]